MIHALSIIVGSIIVGAIGDGLNDRGKKTIGHGLCASEIGILLASPWIINIDPDFPIQYGLWYGLGYILIRMGLFGVIRNIANGDKPGYLGNSSLWGKFMRKLNAPPMGYWIGRAVALSAGISILLKEL